MFSKLKLILGLALAVCAHAQVLPMGYAGHGGGGGSTISATPVQNAKNTPGSGSNVKAFAMNVTAGNLLTVAISSDTNATVPTGCSDNVNGAWAHVVDSDNGSNWIISVWYLKNAGAGATTVTCAMSGSTSVGMMIAEWSGASTTTPLDTFATSTDVNNVGPITVTLDNELLYVAAVHGGTFIACMSGMDTYTQIDNANFLTQSDVQVLQAGAAAAYDATGCSFQAFFDAYVLAAFK